MSCAKGGKKKAKSNCISMYEKTFSHSTYVITYSVILRDSEYQRSSKEL